MEEKTYQIYKLKNVKYIFSIEKGEEINYTLDVYEYICSFNIKREHELLKEHIHLSLLFAQWFHHTTNTTMKESRICLRLQTKELKA